VKHVRTANGEQEIAFHNGSVILFGAREQGFGRGFDEVDAEIFDEAQILTEKALEDMVAATNQSRHPHGALLFFMGTPPRPVDPGEAFTYKRTQALTGQSDDIAYIEMGADPGADPDDQEQWAKANPSFPELTPLESMLRMRSNLPSVDSWFREGLGIWDDESLAAVISPAAWTKLTDPDPGNAPDRMAVFAVEIDLNRIWVSIGAAGRRADGRVHVELVERRRGTDWLLDFCLELEEKHGPARFAIAGDGPAKTEVDDFKAAGLLVDRLDANDIAKACADMVDAVNQGTVVHGPQPKLDEAIRGMKKRSLGDGAFAFSRKNSDADVTPFVAVTLARYAAVEFDYDVLESVY
jgi:hypothetical protein